MNTTLAAADHTLAAPTHKVGLQEPPTLWSKSVFGPTAVFTALAIGSGELVFWPGLVLPYGAGVLWLAIGVIVLQWVVNTEIGRYALATGESISVGAGRLWRGWSWVLLLGTVIPWLWPGWARAGAQLISGATSIPERPLSIASLFVCGLMLAAPSKVYASLERIQSILLAFILFGVAALLLLVLSSSSGTAPFWTGFFSADGGAELLTEAAHRRSTNFLTLLGGLVFAGAGGILNLGYGMLLCEKGFGMGRYSQAIHGLKHSRGLSGSTVRIGLPDDEPTVARWKRWITLIRREHAILFIGGNVFTMVFIALVFFTLLEGRTSAQGTTFLLDATTRLGAEFGPVAAALLVAIGFAIFFTSELGIIDVTSRIAAAIVHDAVRPTRLSASAIYHLFVWGEVLAGTLLIAADPRQPIWFLVTSAVLNTVVMAIYIALLLVLNRRDLPAFARPSLLTQGVLAGTAALYAALFLYTLTRL